MIGTHSGVFHADETFAVAVLTQMERFRNFGIVRTRDAETLKNCAVVVDVGDVYNEARLRFDHHQPPEEGKPADRENGIPFSSFGLVWQHLGIEFLRENFDLSFEKAVVAHAKVDRDVVQAIDAGDTGYELADSWKGATRPLTVNGFISSFNPRSDEDQGEESYDSRFREAVELAYAVLHRAVDNAIHWAQYAQPLEELLNAQTGAVLTLPESFPWQEHILTSGNPRAGEILYVVFPNTSGSPDFMVQCVPDALNSFGKRKALPEAWGGKRTDALAELTGCPSAVFCHGGLFICGADDQLDAIKMAHLAVDA